MTPLTRKENYLNEIVGWGNTAPEKPLTPEEFFFAAILGEAVQVPDLSNASRYELFLAKIAGYNVNVSPPIYTSPRLEFFLAKAAGMDVVTPTPQTREEIYWARYRPAPPVPTEFTVSYYGQDGSTLLGTETVENGGNASGLQDTPTKPDTEQYTYTFAGWSNTTNATTATSGILNNITADKSVYAAFSETEKTFTVTFYNGEELIYTAQNVSYNGTAVYSGDTPTKAETAQYTYTFAGWNSDSSASTADTDALKNVTTDREVYAIFTQVEKTFTVTFYNGDTVVDTVSNIAYNGTATYGGETPTKASTAQYSYNFLGWNADSTASTADSNALNNITANRTVYAIFEQVARTFTVYFYNESTLLETVTGVSYGGTATYSGVTPTKQGYIFTEWSPSPTNITADTSCYAQFEQIPDYITDSWETISQRSAAGTAQNYYSVGDCKPVYLNGTMGTLALNTTLYVYILGFNHNSSYEGNGITFGGFKTAATNGVDVCLIDSHYNLRDTSGLKWFNISHYGNNNYGGWKGSDIRYDILGSTDVQPSGYGSAPTTSKVGYDATSTCATNPVSNTLMSCLPSDLRAVMKPMTKYTDNTGNSSNTSSTVTTSTDYLPLLAEFEVFGTRNYANETEKNKQAQYAYFVAGNSKIKYNQSNLSSACIWWLRSPSYGNTISFCIVNTDGSAIRYSARSSLGVAPAFLV